MLLLAVWIGLIAGFLDFGLLVVNKRLDDRDFYRLGGDFAWIIPMGVTVLVLVPGIADRPLSRERARRARPRGSGRRAALFRRVPRRVRAGFLCMFGHRCSYAVASPRNRSGWCALAVWRSCGSCAARSFYSPESC